MAERGTLYGVGTGPGDPELLTLKAARAIGHADVLAYFAKRGNRSNARRIVQDHIRQSADEIPLFYPVTTELPKHCRSYRAQIASFYDQSAAKLAERLDAGRSVVVLSEGDPLFYGSYMHVHSRLSGRFPTVVIPGVTAMSGCWSQAGAPIAQGDDATSILPGTMAEEMLAEKLKNCDAAIIMKVGRNLPKVRKALIESGRIHRAIYVERGTMDNGVTMPLSELTHDRAPYFSIILVPGWESDR